MLRAVFNTLVKKDYFTENPIRPVSFHNDEQTDKTVYSSLNYKKVSKFIDSLNTSIEGKFVVLTLMRTGCLQGAAL